MADNSVDILTDDDFLHIFSLLSLADRGRAARVCRRWNHLMKDSTLWKCINLWDSRLQHVTDDASVKSTWSFARNEHQVLDFLKAYVGLALREIYLHTVSDAILKCLTVKCPELQFISLSSAFSLLSNKIPSDVDLCLIPGHIQEVVLAVQRGRKRGRKLARGASVGRFLLDPLPKLQRLTMRDILFNFELFRRISCCQKLTRLELTDCYDLTENGFILLTLNIPGIEEIRLENCRYGVGGHGTLDVSKELTGILGTISKKLTQIRTFHLLSNLKIPRVPLDEFLGRLGGFQTLRCVCFHGIRGFTSVGFQDVVKSLVHLEELQISQSDDVTDGLLLLVARYLQNLHVLQVPLADNITDAGVMGFKHHPCLTKVNFAFCKGVSGQAMYDTFISLQKLKQVILSSRSDKTLVPFAERIQREMPYVSVKEL